MGLWQMTSLWRHRLLKGQERGYIIFWCMVCIVTSTSFLAPYFAIWRNFCFKLKHVSEVVCIFDRKIQRCKNTSVRWCQHDCLRHLFECIFQNTHIPPTPDRNHSVMLFPRVPHLIREAFPHVEWYLEVCMVLCGYIASFIFWSLHLQDGSSSSSIRLHEAHSRPPPRVHRIPKCKPEQQVKAGTSECCSAPRKLQPPAITQWSSIPMKVIYDAVEEVRWFHRAAMRDKKSSAGSSSRGTFRWFWGSFRAKFELLNDWLDLIARVTRCVGPVAGNFRWK